MRYQFVACLLTLLLAGCSIIPLGNDKPRDNRTYLLDVVPDVAPQPGRYSCLVVVANPPEAAPGFSGAQMLYSREANRIERFAYSRWAATPARMLEPMLLNSLRATDAFSAVLAAPAAVVADLRIEVDELKLLQKFDGKQSSMVHLAFSARVYAPKERRLLASQQFTDTVATSAANPQAGVTATEQALRQQLLAFTDFVLQAADQLQSDCPTD